MKDRTSANTVFMLEGTVVVAKMIGVCTKRKYCSTLGAPKEPERYRRAD